MDITIERLQTGRKCAAKEWMGFKPLLDEVFEFVIPYARGISQTGAYQKRADRVFDHTAIESARRSANKLAEDLWPSGQQGFALKIGPLAELMLAGNDNAKRQLQDQLEPITAVCNAHFQTGEWDTAKVTMCANLNAAGNGPLLIIPDKRKQTSRFISVPVEEVKVTSNGYGELNAFYWDRSWTLQSIADEWPEEWKAVPQALHDELKQKPESEKLLHQDCVFDVRSERWVRVCWIDHPEGTGKDTAKGIEFERSESRTCPWVYGRYITVAGESYGRGLAMLAMPLIKAVNTGKRLTLQAAAIALLGIFTHVDDGVFNPDNAPVAPMAFWKVSRNGGVMGPTVQRFPDPRLDLTQFIFKDMELSIRAALGDNQLPPDTAAVKSATEIMERIKQSAQDHFGAYGRLVKEVVVAAVQRVMEIAYDFKQLPQEVAIDRLLTDITVASPLAMAREAERMQRITQFIDICIYILQAKAAGLDRYAKTDVIIPDIARGLGVPQNYVPTDEERQAMDQQQQAMAAASAVVENADAVAAAVPALAEAA